MTDLLTLNDIVVAAFWTFIVFFIVRVLSRVFKMLFLRPGTFTLRPEQLEPRQMENVLENCYKLFPNENLIFAGATYKRGMFVRIITSKHNIIEGKFIGINDDNMMCLLTDNSVIAHEIRNITEIREV
jgi:hypothetical protein